MFRTSIQNELLHPTSCSRCWFVSWCTDGVIYQIILFLTPCRHKLATPCLLVFPVTGNLSVPLCGMRSYLAAFSPFLRPPEAFTTDLGISSSSVAHWVASGDRPEFAKELSVIASSSPMCVPTRKVLKWSKGASLVLFPRDFGSEFQWELAPLSTWNSRTVCDQGATYLRLTELLHVGFGPSISQQSAGRECQKSARQ